MATNSILAELHAARKEIMAEHGNDLGAYLRDAAERSKASGHPVANIKQRKICRTSVTKSGELPIGNLTSSPIVE